MYGVSPTSLSLSLSLSTEWFLQARNLKRYINQLTYAKAQCERRIAVLKSGKGGEVGGSASSDKNDANFSLQNLPGRKVSLASAHYF